VGFADGCIVEGLADGIAVGALVFEGAKVGKAEGEYDTNLLVTAKLRIWPGSAS